jgi:hypothetical protein
MTTVFAGFDVHRAQITVDALGSETGEITRGRINSTRRRSSGGSPGFRAGDPCRGRGMHRMAVRLPGARALRRDSHLAEPVETSALRGRKRRAKTDREDARSLRGRPLAHERQGARWRQRPHPESLSPARRAPAAAHPSQVRWGGRTVTGRLVAHIGRPGPVGELDPEPQHLRIVVSVASTSRVGPVERRVQSRRRGNNARIELKACRVGRAPPDIDRGPFTARDHPLDGDHAGKGALRRTAPLGRGRRWPAWPRWFRRRVKNRSLQPNRSSP